jgi:hypothetical protein
VCGAGDFTNAAVNALYAILAGIPCPGQKSVKFPVVYGDITLSGKEAHISTIYLISDHGKLSKTNEIFEFIGIDGKVCKIFPHNTESFIISGIVTITGEAMRLAIRHKINMVFTSRNGKYNGKLEFGNAPNMLLRKRQFLLSSDEDVSLSYAKSIVAAKILKPPGWTQCWGLCMPLNMGKKRLFSI